MLLDPRSSLQDVTALFASSLTDDSLADVLGILCADPNWQVQVTYRATARDLSLRYHPVGGPPLAVRLEHVETPRGLRVWRATT